MIQLFNNYPTLYLVAPLCALEILVRLLPTKKDISFISLIYRIFDQIIPNNKKR